MDAGSLVLTLGVLAAAGLSARWNWWRLAAKGVPILMYHKVGDPPSGSKLKKLWVSAGEFRWQMSYLVRHRYTPVTFEDVVRMVDLGIPLPPNPVILTFDDGYRNNYENAFPILKEFGFRAVFFIVIDAVEKENFWHDPASEVRLPMMSWKQIEELRSAGMEIGSHTFKHSRLSQLSDEAALEQIRLSRDALALRFGKPPVSFAHPYGAGADEPRIQKLIQQAGYRCACSVHQGKADMLSSPFCLKRLFIRGDDLHLDFHLQMTRGKSRF